MKELPPGVSPDPSLRICADWQRMAVTEAMRGMEADMQRQAAPGAGRGASFVGTEGEFDTVTVPNHERWRHSATDEIVNTTQLRLRPHYGCNSVLEKCAGHTGRINFTKDPNDVKEHLAQGRALTRDGLKRMLADRAKFGRKVCVYKRLIQMTRLQSDMAVNAWDMRTRTSARGPPRQCK